MYFIPAKRNATKRVGRNPFFARVAIPRGESVAGKVIRRKRSKSGRFVKAKRRTARRNPTPTVGVFTMPEALIVNPRRRRRSKRRVARGAGGRFVKRGTRGRVTRRRRARRNPGEEMIIVNPRRRSRGVSRRRARRARRAFRRNPGILGGFSMRTALPHVGGALAGGLAGGFLDTRSWFTDKDGKERTMLKMLAKVAGGLIAGGLASKVNPIAGAAFGAAMIGTATYAKGIEMGGGIVVKPTIESKKAALSALAADSDMAILIREELSGMGLLIPSAGGGGARMDGMSDGAMSAMRSYAAMSED